MNYPANAHRGLKLIFLACIVSLVSALLSVFIALIPLLNLRVSTEMRQILVYAPLGFTVVCSLLELIGAGRASKDDEYFGRALTQLVLALVFSILKKVLETPSELLSNICGLISGFAGLFAVLDIIKGIMRVSDVLGWRDMQRQGRGLYKLTVVLSCCIIALPILTVLAAALVRSSRTLHAIAGFFTMAMIVFLIADVVQVVWYMVYLHKGIKITNVESSNAGQSHVGQSNMGQSGSGYADDPWNRSDSGSNNF